MSLQLVGKNIRVTFLDVPGNAGASISKWITETKSLLVKFPWEDYDGIDDDFPDPSYQYIDVLTGKLTLPFQRPMPKPVKEKENLQFNTLQKTLEIYKKLGTTFGVCRNPYERLVSFWKKQKQQSKTDQNFDQWCTTMIAILASSRRDDDSSGIDYLRQIHFLRGCDIVLKYENIEQEFCQIANLVNDDRPFKILEDDRDRIDDFMSYYTPINRMAISIFLKEDFKAFNYEI